MWLSQIHALVKHRTQITLQLFLNENQCIQSSRAHCTVKRSLMLCDGPPEWWILQKYFCIHLGQIIWQFSHFTARFTACFTAQRRSALRCAVHDEIFAQCATLQPILWILYTLIYILTVCQQTNTSC